MIPRRDIARNKEPFNYLPVDWVYIIAKKQAFEEVVDRLD